MENKKYQNYFIIVKEGNTGEKRERETIASVPAENGTFTTDQGVLEVEVCPITQDNLQKVIFSGDVIPTIKKRGKVKGRKSQRRRVVDFPLKHTREIRQDRGSGEQLIFQRAERLVEENE